MWKSFPAPPVAAAGFVATLGREPAFVQVVLMGDRDALEAAVTAPPAPDRRRTGMGVGAW